MKHISKFLTLFIVFSVVALSSCKKEDEILDEITINLPTETIEQEVIEALVTVSGVIQGVVHDGSNSGVLDGVTVGYAANGTTGSVTASSTGGFSIPGLAPGEYILTFAKDGFTTVTANVTIPTYQGDEETVPEGGTWVVVESVEPSLYPLTAGAKGFLFIDNYPAEGITVQLDYTIPGDYQLSPSLFTTVVNEDGYFEFDNIPGTMAFLKVPACNFMGYEIDGYTEMFSISANTITSLGVVELYWDDYADIEVVEFNWDYITGFDPKNGIEVTFNQTIDLNHSSFELWDDDNSLYVPVSVVGSKALNTIVIVPENELLLETDYYLDWEVVTTSGVYEYGYEYFWTMNGINFSSSNIQGYAGDSGPFYDVEIDQTITVTFTLNVDPEMTRKNGAIFLENDDTGEEMETSIVFNGNTIEITPVNNLDYNTKYFGYLRIFSSYNDDYIESGFYFYTVTEADPVLEVAPSVVFAEDFLADDDTKNIPLVITAVEGGYTYSIYAKDNHNNPEWVFIDYVTQSIPDNWVGEFFINRTVELPERFDYYNDDSEQTPFSHGTEVSFRVVSSNDLYESPASEVISIGDKIAFSSGDFDFSSQFDEDFENEITSVDNSLIIQELDVFFSFDFPEGFYVDETIIPTVGINDPLGDPATDAEVSFEWIVIDGKNIGIIMVKIDPLTDATDYEITINGVSDTSGNIQTEEVSNYLYTVSSSK